MPLRLPRRNLLAAAACTPLAAAAQVRGAAALPAPAPQAVNDGKPAQPATYHETEHTRRYYRSAARL